MFNKLKIIVFGTLLILLTPWAFSKGIDNPAQDGRSSYFDGAQSYKSTQLARRRGGGGVQRSRPTHKPAHEPAHRPTHKPSYKHYHGKRWFWYEGVIPAGAVILYHSQGAPVYGCLATYKGMQYEGNMRSGGPCYIDYNGRAVAVYEFYVMTN